jgi:hypothetical protein
MWLFIGAVANLEPDVVSNNSLVFYMGKGYSVLLANCPAICFVIFVMSCHFCMGQNVLAI